MSFSRRGDWGEAGNHYFTRISSSTTAPTVTRLSSSCFLSMSGDGVEVIIAGRMLNSTKLCAYILFLTRWLGGDGEGCQCRQISSATTARKSNATICLFWFSLRAFRKKHKIIETHPTLRFAFFGFRLELSAKKPKHVETHPTLRFAFVGFRLELSAKKHKFIETHPTLRFAFFIFA